MQETKRRSFIEEARRAQIVAAAIDTLAELGYGKASLTQIAKRAGISTSLISYHFKEKDELMQETFTQVYSNWTTYVQDQLSADSTATERLHTYIEANLAYMGTRPKHFEAMIEIIFNARSEDGTLLYRGDEDSEGALQLAALLAEGQKTGEFRQFDVQNMAIALRGTIDQFLGQIARRPSFNLEAYTAQLIDLFNRAILQE
ncbi:MAG TPA: TetR family transcriptional regulator [Roseiflexaceae bacterium]|nr:TetR family transcriptional regulator [Roseiflexaceae bacterium]